VGAGSDNSMTIEEKWCASKWQGNESLLGLRSVESSLRDVAIKLRFRVFILRSSPMRLFIFLFTVVGIGCLPATAEEIHLLSYNVRHATDFDGKPALDRQAAIIRDSNASIIGLQEIDEKCKRSGNVDQAVALAKATKTVGKFGSFMEFDGGRYGMAMLSKLEIKRTDIVRLPAGREPRVAIVLEVETPSGFRLLVANVHFDWTSEDLRVPQAKGLIEHLNERKLAAVVLGDYNAKPDSLTLKVFQEAGFEFIEKPKEKRFTFDSRKPTIEIDHVSIRSGGGVKVTAKSINVLPEDSASDHRPVSATIELVAEPK